jgi:hypothetical protein
MVNKLLKRRTFNQMFALLVGLDIVFYIAVIVFSFVVENFDLSFEATQIEGIFLILFFPLVLIVGALSFSAARILDADKHRVFLLFGNIMFYNKILYYLIMSALYELEINTAIRGIVLLSIFAAVLIAHFIFYILKHNNKTYYIDWLNRHYIKDVKICKKVYNDFGINKKLIFIIGLAQGSIMVYSFNLSSLFGNNIYVLFTTYLLLSASVFIYVFYSLRFYRKIKMLSINKILFAVLSSVFIIGCHYFLVSLDLWLIANLLYQALNFNFIKLIRDIYNFRPSP